MDWGYKYTAKVEYGFYQVADPKDGITEDFASTKVMWGPPGKLKVAMCFENSGGLSHAEITPDWGKGNILSIANEIHQPGLPLGKNGKTGKLQCYYEDNAAFASVGWNHGTQIPTAIPKNTVNGMNGTEIGNRALICGNQPNPYHFTVSKTSLAVGGSVSKLCAQNFHHAIGSRFWEFGNYVSPHENDSSWLSPKHAKREKIVQSANDVEKACKTMFPKETAWVMDWTRRHFPGADVIHERGSDSSGSGSAGGGAH